MKKQKTLGMAVLVTLALLVVTTGAVFAIGLAHGGSPWSAEDNDDDYSEYWGPMHGRRGTWSTDEPLMHDAMVQTLADVTGLAVDEIEDRISEGEHLLEIALDAGLDQAAFFDLMQESRESLLAEALESGLITEDQYQWMQNRRQDVRYERGFGGCHELEGEAYPQDGRMPRRGSGRRW
ncbi:MAG: hypothetical protein K0B06_06410 [Brevefilum sp.]|nr:hypothetical protein [Brevefilum sp.]